MAPEIIEGASHIDGRADLYSLGCVAYWLLSGKLVFDAASPIKMVASHLNAEPARLSERAEQAIPDLLEQLVHACLAKDPGARPQSAQELSERLAALSFDSAWSQEHASTWWETHVKPPDRAGPSAETEPIDPMAHTLADE